MTPGETVQAAAPGARRGSIAIVRLLVVRHGETSWNRAGRYQGCLDTRLSAAGRRQAEALARALTDRRIEAVYSSPLRRALETARAIAAVHGRPLHTEAALREICHGAWEGLTVREVAAAFPVLWALWYRRPDRAVMPGGESLADVKARVLPAIARIVRHHAQGAVCVVTHGVTARVILARAQGRPLSSLWRIDSPAAAISELLVRDGRYLVRRLNAVSHLPAPPQAHAAR